MTIMTTEEIALKFNVSKKNIHRFIKRNRLHVIASKGSANTGFVWHKITGDTLNRVLKQYGVGTVKIVSAPPIQAVDVRDLKIKELEDMCSKFEKKFQALSIYTDRLEARLKDIEKQTNCVVHIEHKVNEIRERINASNQRIREVAEAHNRLANHHFNGYHPSHRQFQV